MAPMPGTLVSFHAHPDDEAILVAGTLALAADAGHRVVLVFATRGDLGEVDDGVLEASEELGDRRADEARRAAEVLGVARVEFLGYGDSGMIDTPTNDAPGSFWTADVEEAARQLAAILEEEDAEVVTAYDERGGYGHPDHIQVHRVGVRVAELAGTPRCYAATVSRQYFQSLRQEPGIDLPEENDASDVGRRRGRVVDHHRRRRVERHRPQARGDGRAPVADRRGVVLPRARRRHVPAHVGHRVVHPPRQHPGAHRDLAVRELSSDIAKRFPPKVGRR